MQSRENNRLTQKKHHQLGNDSPASRPPSLAGRMRGVESLDETTLLIAGREMVEVQLLNTT
jgi:hypothetical protein